MPSLEGRTLGWGLLACMAMAFLAGDAAGTAHCRIHHLHAHAASGSRNSGCPSTSIIESAIGARVQSADPSRADPCRPGSGRANLCGPHCSSVCGTSACSAGVRGASIRRTGLPGASVRRTRLRGASIRRTGLPGASPNRARGSGSRRPMDRAVFAYATAAGTQSRDARAATPRDGCRTGRHGFCQGAKTVQAGASSIWPVF